MILHEVAPIASLVLLVFVLAGMVHLYLSSRKWTLPVQSARLDVLEEDQKVLRGNLRRVERDSNEWYRSISLSMDNMLRELQAIKMNGAKEHPMEEELESIRDRLMDLEQIASTLPCSPACPLPLAGKE